MTFDKFQYNHDQMTFDCVGSNCSTFIKFETRKLYSFFINKVAHNESCAVLVSRHVRNGGNGGGDMLLRMFGGGVASATADYITDMYLKYEASTLYYTHSVYSGESNRENNGGSDDNRLAALGGSSGGFGATTSNEAVREASGRGDSRNTSQHTAIYRFNIREIFNIVPTTTRNDEPGLQIVTEYDPHYAKDVSRAERISFPQAGGGAGGAGGIDFSSLFSGGGGHNGFAH